MEYKDKLVRFTKRRSIKYGLPFVLFVVGGSVGLREFTDLRYRYKKSGALTREQIAEAGVEMKKGPQATLESEYLKIKEMDTSNWENVRIPRPWEENDSET